MADTKAVVYNDPSANNFPNDYDQSGVDARTALRVLSVRNKMYGKDVREAIAEGLELNSIFNANNIGQVASTIFSTDNLVDNGNFANGQTAPARAFSPSTNLTIEQKLFDRNWLHIRSTNPDDGYAGANFLIENGLMSQLLDLRTSYSEINFTTSVYATKSQKVQFTLGYYDEQDTQIANPLIGAYTLEANKLKKINVSFELADVTDVKYLKLGIISENQKTIDLFITDIQLKPSFNNNTKLIKNGDMKDFTVGNALAENNMQLDIVKDKNTKSWLNATWHNATYPRITWELPLNKFKEISKGVLAVNFNILANSDNDKIAVRLSTYGTNGVNKTVGFDIRNGKKYKKSVALPFEITSDITSVKLFIFDASGVSTSGDFLITDISADVIKPTRIDDSPEFTAVEDTIAFGDSITWGLHSSDNTVNSWTANLMAYAGVNITNTAVSGATWTHKTDRDYGMVDVIKRTDISDVRNIVAFGGTNDFAQDLPIGTIDDTDPMTLYGAMNVGIQSIYERNPKVSIYLVTPMWRARINDANSPVDIETTKNGAGFLLLDYVNAVIDIARKYHLPVLDLYHEFPINKYNSNSLLADGLHPNDDGYVLLAKKIGKFLNAN